MRSFLTSVLNSIGLESLTDKKPIAVVIKGNPKYLDDPKVKPLAEAFYAEVKQILEKSGYQVEFDTGEPYTLPNKKATLWVGHSRGIDRLRFAGAKIKSMALETMDKGKSYANTDDQGYDPDHYRLSANDRTLLSFI